MLNFSFKGKKLLFISLLIFFLSATFCQVRLMTGGKWYRGNTHTHARFSDDNDNNDVPEIAEWYKTAGYNFLCLSEHNDHLLKKQIFCHEEITESQNFIMICGLELSKTRHHTALGIDQYIGDEISLQDGLKKTIQSNGLPILNHPNDPKINASEFISTIGLNYLEVYNGGRPEDTYASEQLWDSILSMPNGRIVYAVASDDNHYNKSNVGRGWIMVRSNHLTDKSILENIRCGNFYATTGIILNNYLVSKRNVSVSSFNSDTILFIGENGKILKKTAGQNATYRFRGNEKYVRVKLKDKSGKSAWTQPVLVSKDWIRIKN